MFKPATKSSKMDRKQRLLQRNAMLEKREKIAEKHKMCKQFSINVERMDVDGWIKTNVDSDNSLDKEMENIFGDVTNTPEESVISTRKQGSIKSDNQLGKHENGMVLLPKSFYNKNPPAKPVVTAVRTSVRNALRKEKNNPTKNTVINTYPVKSSPKINSKPTRTYVNKKCQTVKNNDVNKKCQPVKEDNDKKDESTVVEPEISLKKLSALIKPEILPSKLWEIDRIPLVKESIIDPIEEKMKELLGDSGTVEKMDIDEEMKIADTKNGDVENSDKEIGELSPKNNTNGEVIKSNEEVTTVVPETAAQEEFPSIMDILNEKPVCESTDDKINSDVTPSLSLDVVMEAKDDDAKETVTEIPKIKEAPQNPDCVLKTVIFKRHTEDKESFDRLVTFQFNLEYSVVINDKTIELLGAPGIITDIEDIKILLQIVDDISLDSFNIVYKS